MEDNNNAVEFERLPLLVAERRGFPLQYHVTNRYKYSVNDWLNGIVTTARAARLWNELKHKAQIDLEKLSYRASNDKIYQTDFADSVNLLKITRLTKGYRAIVGLEELLTIQTKDCDGYIYIIGMKASGGLFKVGITTNIKKRLSMVSTYNPFEPYYEMYIRSERYMEIEDVIHREIQGNLVSGEWFRLTPVELTRLKKHIIELTV